MFYFKSSLATSVEREQLINSIQKDKKMKMKQNYLEATISERVLTND